MQIIDAATTARHLGAPALIAALRALFTSGCEVPLRHTHKIGDAGTLLLMPAWRHGARLGIKTVAIFPGNGERGLPGLHAVYTLFDATTGVPLAVIDGSELTARRTAAASALAASFLAREDATRLLVIGAGRVAALVPEAMRSVRPGLARFAVWNRHPARAEELAAQWRGAWLAPGTHLDLVGSFTPAMRESDGACFATSRVFVDTDEALAKSGDVLQAIAEGHFALHQVQATLAQLCRGEDPGRQRADEITLFKSVGTALEDLAAAELALPHTDNRPTPS